MRIVRAAVILLGLAIAIGLAVFVSILPSYTENLTTGDDIAASDGIVVPTGGRDRISTGLGLLSQGAGRLLITGVYADTSLQLLLTETGHVSPGCCIDLDRLATDTAGNAAAAKAWTEANKIERIFLVTSWYHMPRSQLLFRDAMPKVGIVPYPVFARETHAADWWMSYTGWRLVLTEYAKFLWALVWLELGV